MFSLSFKKQENDFYIFLLFAATHAPGHHGRSLRVRIQHQQGFDIDDKQRTLVPSVFPSSLVATPQRRPHNNGLIQNA